MASCDCFHFSQIFEIDKCFVHPLNCENIVPASVRYFYCSNPVLGVKFYARGVFLLRLWNLSLRELKNCHSKDLKKLNRFGEVEFLNFA